MMEETKDGFVKVERENGISTIEFYHPHSNSLPRKILDALTKAIITEGWDPILGWRSANYVYKPADTANIKLLMKNYKLSDDIAFRFSNRHWSEWPLTTDKFCYWAYESDHGGDIINLFMDYETFGEHQWADTGIFDFLRTLPAKWLSMENTGFRTITEAATSYEVKDEVDIPQTITWAD